MRLIETGIKEKPGSPCAADELKRELQISQEEINALAQRLNEARDIDNELALTVAQLDDMRARSEKLRRETGRELPDLYAAEQSLLLEYHLLMQARQRVRALIALLPDNRQRQVLEMRCLDGRTNYTIAAALNYSERHVYRLYHAALETLAAILKYECM